ncbi:cytochrome P450 oxidoreductase [Xylogone sp. PMI_703]|nr:cytochrome P450 oxidoreductase [Xylogone sp. PMI_703]
MSFLLDIVKLIEQYWLHILVGAIIIRLIFNRYKRGLSDIPGPLLASLTDLWFFGNEKYKLHDKYKSPLLRLGPNTVSIADSEAVRIIYGWKPVFKKVRYNGSVLENISSTRNEMLHRDLRRPVAHGYSLSTIIEFKPLVDSTSIVFMKQMEEQFAVTRAECQLSKWLQMYAFDIIGELTFSQRFGFLGSGKDLYNMMYHTGRAMDYIGMIGQNKGFGHILRKFRPTGPLMKFTVKQIREHIAAKDDSRPDLLTRFIKAREKYPELITDRRLATYTNTNISAGSDTTAIALREVVHRILTHPGCYDKFMMEVKRALRARSSDDNYTKPITWTESQGMPYFQAVIKECLRLHSALGQIIPRDVPKGGVEICGKFLPEGTVVGCNAWTVHRDRKLYGDDADVFRPERWLDSDLEQLRNMENLSFAFGGGPPICLGKNIAMLEISKFIPEFFRRFDITLVDPTRYKLIPGWLVLQDGLDVILNRRDPAWLQI